MTSFKPSSNSKHHDGNKCKGSKERGNRFLPGRRSAQKRSNLLAVASELFLAKGYDGVSRHEIIAAVGGSKTTIYSYFEGKEGVFVAAVSALCDEILAKLLRTKAFSMPLREALQAIGHAYLDAVLSPRAVALQRLVIGDASFPGGWTNLVRKRPRANLPIADRFFRRA